MNTLAVVAAIIVAVVVAIIVALLNSAGGGGGGGGNPPGVVVCGYGLCEEKSTTSNSVGCDLMDKGISDAAKAGVDGCTQSGPTWTCSDLFTSDKYSIEDVPTTSGGKKSTGSREIFVSVPKTPGSDDPFLLWFHCKDGNGFNAPGNMGKLHEVLIPAARKYVVVTLIPNEADLWYAADFNTVAPLSLPNATPNPVSDGCPDVPSNYWNMACWRENIEQPFLQKVMSFLRSKTKLKLDSCVIGGMSAGAAMASRAVESFPSMVDEENKSFPTIVGHMAISGASLQCYAYKHSKDGSGSDDVVPSWFLDGCADKALGCCPNYFLEPSYTIDKKGVYTSHPPVFLTQPIKDNNAAANASSKYLTELATGDGVGFRMVGSGPIQHGLPDCAVTAAAEFLLRALAKQSLRKVSA